MNDKDIQALKALAEATTPGPWTYGSKYVAKPHNGTYSSIAQCPDGAEGTPEWFAQARWIAAANPQAILSLIASYEQQAARIAELEATLALRTEEYESANEDRLNMAVEIAELKKRPAVDLSGLTRAYNSGYKAGHQDTVEAQYTDIDQRDMDTYHSDVVGELVADGTLSTYAVRGVRLTEARIIELFDEEFGLQDLEVADNEVVAFVRSVERELVAAGNSVDDYARMLAMHLWREHYRETSPQFELFDDTHGVLSQIDNMLTGLVLSTANAAQALDGELPPPDCSYADHSYPAYSAKVVRKAIGEAQAGGREQALEEAAKVCEQRMIGFKLEDAGLVELAAAIRSLKSTPSPSVNSKEGGNGKQ